MGIPLLSLPCTLELSIYRKTQTYPLCRLRCASKTIDLFVEKNKFRITNVPEIFKDGEWGLLIHFNTKGARPHLLVRRLPGNHQNHVYNDFTGRKPFFRISPTKFHLQLSAVRFFNRADFRGSVEDDIILEVLEKLSLKCHWLSIFYTQPFDRMFSLIGFKNFTTGFIQMSASVIEKWPLWTCDQINLDRVINVNSLANLIFNASKVEFDLLTSPPPPDSPTDLLAACLNEFRENRQRRKSLEYLHVIAEFLEHPFDVEGWTLLWRGFTYDRPGMPLDCQDAIYKTPLDGGFAIIRRDAMHCFVHFVSDDKRDTLLGLTFHNIFRRSPFDLSAVYDQFLDADNDQEAFQNLVGEYYRD